MSENNIKSTSQRSHEELDQEPESEVIYVDKDQVPPDTQAHSLTHDGMRYFGLRKSTPRKQNISKEDARKVLEFMRSNDGEK